MIVIFVMTPLVGGTYGRNIRMATLASMYIVIGYFLTARVKMILEIFPLDSFLKFNWHFILPAQPIQFRFPFIYYPRKTYDALTHWKIVKLFETLLVPYLHYCLVTLMWKCYRRNENKDHNLITLIYLDTLTLRMIYIYIYIYILVYVCK